MFKGIRQAALAAAVALAFGGPALAAGDAHEHLSRILRHLVAEGLIEVRGRTVDIPDIARLRAWRKP